jgi:dipeptidyl aminopeptidase/acylaminoacyl peptidase
MSRSSRPVIGLLLLALPTALLAQAPQAPFTADDLVRVKRLSGVEASPDGRYVAYVLRETDMDANKGTTDIWLLDTTAKNAEPRRLTQHAANDSSPRWTPDSQTLYFLSSRSGSSQVWRLTLSGGEPTRVTDFPLDVGSLKVSPTGDRLALSLDVIPGCADVACTKEKLNAQEKSKATGQVYDKLFMRHWDTWKNGTRSHLFTVPVSADGVAGAVVDVSKAIDGDVPSKPFGDDEDYDFSPDGKRLVFSARVAGKTEPWSTNFDLFEVPADGSAEPRNLTQNNPAWDAQPTFLRNGDLAYLAMDRPGFEADRFRVMLRDARTGATRDVTGKWDRSISDLEPTADNRRLLVAVDDIGQHALYAVDTSNGTPRKLVGTGQVTSFAAVKDGIVYSWGSLGTPPDLHSIRANGGTPKQLTHVNQEMLSQRAMSEFEQYSFKGWNDETVYGYVIKPYGYEAGKRYPVAFIVHGGPQASLQNQWNYRWNAQAFAGAGYGVVMIDFHGSPGYGQAFTDSISGDWGGKPLVDLQKGLAAALERYSWLDGDRACALGASYGGFMMNWIAGKWPERFRCLVNHDGIFDQRTMYYSTEELWFPEWENGGPYFDKPQNYEKFNPANHVTAWKTPMLVIHGGLDFRVPDDQGLATFTALQRRAIESQLLFFPDENHWVLKPANSVQWYSTVIGWLDKQLGIERSRVTSRSP